MASLNQCSFIGHIGQIETRYLPNGDAVTNLSIAINDKYKNKSGEMVDHTEWVRISLFTKLAQIAEKYLKKGDLVYVSGAMRTRKYQDKDGIEKQATEIRGDRLQMLGGKPSEDTAQHTASRAAMNAQKPGGFDDMDADSIPF